MSARFPQLRPPDFRTQERRVCGCFGTEHRPLTNCLSCGRVHCAEEGMGKCLFCGARLEIVKKLEGYAEAEERADRLHFFQETQAQRTVVRDMTGEDPLKLDIWCKPDKQLKRKPRHEPRRRVQYDQTDLHIVLDLPDGDADADTAALFNIALPQQTRVDAEAADPDD